MDQVIGWGAVILVQVAACAAIVRAVRQSFEMSSGYSWGWARRHSETASGEAAADARMAAASCEVSADRGTASCRRGQQRH